MISVYTDHRVKHKGTFVLTRLNPCLSNSPPLSIVLTPTPFTPAMSTVTFSHESSLDDVRHPELRWSGRLDLCLTGGLNEKVP